MQASKNSQPRLDGNSKHHPSFSSVSFLFSQFYISNSLSLVSAHYLSVAVDSAVVPLQYNSPLLLRLDLYVLSVKHNRQQQAAAGVRYVPKGINGDTQYISERKISLPHSHHHQAVIVNVYVNAEVDCRKMADSFISLWPFSIQTHLVPLPFDLFSLIFSLQVHRCN